MVAAAKDQSLAALPPEYAGMIKMDPHRPGRARARLVGYERPVWAVIQHMIAEGDIEDPVTQATPELIALTADDFELSREAVHAALAYYAANRAAIDEIFVANNMGTGG